MNEGIFVAAEDELSILDGSQQGSEAHAVWMSTLFRAELPHNILSKGLLLALCRCRGRWRTKQKVETEEGLPKHIVTNQKTNANANARFGCLMKVHVFLEGDSVEWP